MKVNRPLCALAVGAAAIMIVVVLLVVTGHIHEGLHSYAQTGNVRRLRAALHAGANPNDTITDGKFPGVTPLMLAARAGHEDCVELLLQSGAQVDAINGVGESALHYAVCHPEVVAILIASRADIEQGYNGKTPLWRAAMSGQTNTTELLLQAGAQINMPHSPVEAAASRGHAQTLGLLLQRKDVEPSLQIQMNRALVSAAGNDHRACIVLLLQHGADINARSTLGATALMRASESAAPDVIGLLLDAGADPTLADDMGQRARDYAEQRSDSELIQKMLMDSVG